MLFGQHYDTRRVHSTTECHRATGALIRLLLDDSRFVLRLLIVAELDLALQSSELKRFVERHRMGAVDDAVTALNVE